MTQNNTIVGVWRVQTEGAPFKFHMFAFHNDGTMQQSNPPAGNTETSDSAGLGVWAADGATVKARFEEYRVALKDGAITRGTIDFTLYIKDNSLDGACNFNIYDAETGKHLRGPLAATVKGQRVSL